jgi:penicillin-binding protein 1C
MRVPSTSSLWRCGGPVGLLALGTLLAACAQAPADTTGRYAVYRQRLAALDTRAFPQTTRIVDRHGMLLAEIAPEGQREWVPLRDVPASLQQAIIDTEDQSFYDNDGVDTGAVARAALQNARAGGTVSGASTITMQLVRLVAFEPEERYRTTLDRKLREAQLAAEITQRYTKAEILEAYLNIAYFGHNAYGVQAAARTYFGISAHRLNVAQATLLAGLVQAPAVLDPLINPGGARRRQAAVLARMVDAGHLTEREAELVASAPLKLVGEPPQPPRRAPYFVDYVRSQLPALIGPVLAARGGFTVTTTLDLGFDQRLADLAAGHVASLREAHDLTDAALVAIRPHSGEILALVGGVNYDDPVNGQVNVALRGRQPGSAFKPITYAAALEAGWTAADVLWDIPTRFPAGDPNGYQPVNYDGRYRGPVRLRQALASSLNAAAVNLLADLGLETVHAAAGRFGLRLDPDPWHYGLSLTLGGAEVPLLDLTAAYAALANGGQRAAPFAVTSVRPFAGGAPLYEHGPAPERVVSAETAWLLSDILSDNAARRSAFGANNPLEVSRPAAVKTGTTNDFRDNLTVGYTPYLVVGVWAGNKDGHPMRNVLGITGAAPIWHEAMETVFADPGLLSLLGDGQPPADGFPAPPGIERHAVCDLASLTVAGSCRTLQEAFVTGTAGAGYGRYRLRGGCAVADPAGGQTMLAPPHRPELASQVRQWAQRNGVLVAPAACPEASAAALGAGLAQP